MIRQPDLTEIENWRTEVTKQIEVLEKRVRPLIDEISRKQQELSALDQLIKARSGGNEGGSSELPAPAAPLSSLPVPSHPTAVGSHGSSRPSQATFTSVYTYWPFILSSIIELGGAARGEAVIELVGKKMEHILTPDDKERLSSGTDVRWRNRVAWQRFNMVRDGLLKSGSPRGTWEVTEEGKKWLNRVVNRIESERSANSVQSREGTAEKQRLGGSDGSI